MTSFLYMPDYQPLEVSLDTLDRVNLKMSWHITSSVWAEDSHWDSQGEQHGPSQDVDTSRPVH